MSTSHMYVVKRDGRHQTLDLGKITDRLKNLCDGLSPLIDDGELAMHVVEGIYPGVKTTELDDLAAELSAYRSSWHFDYGILAARIAVSNLHKNTLDSFSGTMDRLFTIKHPKTGKPLPQIDEKVMEFIREHADVLDSAIDHQRDFQYDYFGFKTLERSYLTRWNGNIVERPQHMLMRVACGIWVGDVERALDTYQLLSEGWYTHASPTLFHSGKPNPGLSSCFLLTMKDDSIEGIFDTLKNCAVISKSAGGIGLDITGVRSLDQIIAGTGGTSNGLTPMARVFEAAARYVDQGGNKRKGAFALYLEPWHACVFRFIDLKKSVGSAELRARDLFYGLWIPDIFMRRVAEGGKWSLMSPDDCPGLQDVHSEDFDRLYAEYEAKGWYVRQVEAMDLWKAIITSVIESGAPYILFKDACNRKSNQKNLGTIRCSNLCTEIVQYSSPGEIAVCNLASIALPKFVIDGVFDHQRLYQTVKKVVYSLNRVIDAQYYGRVAETAVSNLRHRPMGIGVQGLADAFHVLRLSFDGPEARRLNKDIFETMYYGALEASMELAQRDGPYDTYQGSPVSQGILQFDMWGVEPDSGRWDWSDLRGRVVAHGIRNSLLIAPMPTASTSQILGNMECFEPRTSNLFFRRTLAGEFCVINKYLQEDLIARGQWTPEMRKAIVAADGSLKHIPGISADLKDIYRTVWEISPKSILEMAADRGPYICQSQSMNLYIARPNFSKVSSVLFKAWRLGLKTGLYYLRTKETSKAQKPTIDPEKIKDHEEATAAVCVRGGPDCVSCSS